MNLFGNEFVNFLITSFSEERTILYRNGVYGFTQKLLAYNSNKIEGSTLTKEHTTALFEDKFEYMPDQDYRRKDVEEATGHFIAFNTMLDHLSEQLSENLIKSLHRELKSGVFEDRMNGYVVGDYKKRPNIIGNYTTTLPKDVPHEMGKLLEWYNSQNQINVNILADFHAKYETIHPFQDGNGRTGRLILFRECLYNGIDPIVIYDSDKKDYIKSLIEYRESKSIDRLVSVFYKGQKRYKQDCEYFRQVIE